MGSVTEMVRVGSVELCAQPSGERGDPAVLLIGGSRDDRKPWFPRLDEIRVPTLVVHGEEDPLFPLPLAEAMVAEIPGATLLVEPGVGHEFVRRSWPVVIPAVLRVSGG